MSKTITTQHPEVGYEKNVIIIETALREQFGLDDNSYVLRAVAAAIWSIICHRMNPKPWCTGDVNGAIKVVQTRINKMASQITGFDSAA